MSLLHRALLSSAFQEMLRKFEPIVKDTLETAVTIVTPAAAPAIDAAIEVADQVLMPKADPAAPAAPGAITTDHIAAAVAASSAPSAADAPAPAAAPAASVAPAAAPANLMAGPAQAALAACDALLLQVSNIATQVQALRANVVGSSGK